MLKTIFFLAALSLPVTAVAAPVPCSKRADILSELSNKFKEAPVGVGLGNNGALFELLTNGEGSTWTLLMTTPNGVSCLIAAGEDWQKREKVASRDPQT